MTERQDARREKLYQLLPAQAREKPWTCLRVTSRHKMAELIELAKTALSAGQTVVLYDLPLPGSASTSATSRMKEGPSVRVSTQLEGLPLPDPQMTPIPGPSTVAATKPRASNKSTSTIGKMISIAEIVKRSYSESAKAAFARKKGKAKAAVEEDEAGRSVLRIHQYNRIACLEELGYEGDENGDEDEAQAQVIQDWLVSGKVKRPPRRHTPVMVIVLHSKALSVLSRDASWTHQPPPKRRAAKQANKTRDEKALT